MRRLDRIEIRDLRLVGLHGVLPEERERRQPFSVDVDAWLAGDGERSSDQLGSTVDYAGLIDAVAAVVVSRSCQLLETLADAAARAALDRDARVAAVTVTVRKLRPPVPYDVGSVGVRVTRRRGGVGEAGNDEGGGDEEA
jgi:dihydroneopterin aldolase